PCAVPLLPLPDAVLPPPRHASSPRPLLQPCAWLRAPRPCGAPPPRPSDALRLLPCVAPLPQLCVVLRPPPWPSLPLRPSAVPLPQLSGALLLRPSGALPPRPCGA